ncbi:NTF2 and RRM domain-containing protein [Colletotrichum abscissum]|uniref:NTF2 and RRM domain-containing protein n=1 Tax=Colletotrichum abscissum TaxID=1671311 RepID=A0A9P9XDK4_9PEZI|nr:NTF2 and RRM domain-containing protein [Colletotrichum abscissum]
MVERTPEEATGPAIITAETAVYKPAKAAETKVEESEATAKEVAEEDITSNSTAEIHQLNISPKSTTRSLLEQPYGTKALRTNSLLPYYIRNRIQLLDIVPAAAKASRGRHNMLGSLSRPWVKLRPCQS